MNTNKGKSMTETIEDTLECRIGKRIKAERLRLSLSQTEFAELGGLTKQAQVNYESGRRVPDILYLLRVKEKTKIDLNFILTGKTGLEKSTLTDHEAALIDLYRENENFQKLMDLAATLATRKEEVVRNEEPINVELSELPWFMA
jgi:transcriptional regulator with XRE-family HTH domain